MNAVLWWLGQNTIAVALMVPVVLLLCWAFRSRPAVQHVLWLVLLVKFLLPPVVEAPWSVASLIAPRQPDPVDFDLPPSPLPPPPPLIEADAEMLVVQPKLIDAPVEIAAPPEPSITLADIGQAVVVLWGIGCGLAFLIQLRRIGRHRTLIRNGATAPRHLDDEIGRVAKHMGLRPIRAIVVRRIASPFVWCFGWLRLVWPEALLAESDINRSRGMIAHELAHVRRRDHWVAWLEFAAGLIWWWNPIFWFVRRRLRESAELACDALAIGALPDERLAYAEMFLELSSSFKSGTPVPVLGMSTGAPSSFERRLTMILSERISGKMSWRGILLAAMLAFAAAPHWTLGQSSRPSAPPPLTDFEKRLRDELRQRESDIEMDRALAAKLSVTNDDANLGRFPELTIVNKLRVPGEQLVLIKMVVAEVNRAAARNVGIIAEKDQSVQRLEPDNGQMISQINTLKSLNYARILAEPSLAVVNGMPANFRDRATTTVPFGISLNATPHISDKDRIRLDFKGSITKLDSATGTIGGVSVPNLTDRTFSTRVELREKQTIALMSPTQGNLGTEIAKAPIPTDAAAKNRPTELDKTPESEKDIVILITPHFVHPLPYRENPPLPGQESKSNTANTLSNADGNRRKTDRDRVMATNLDHAADRVRIIELEANREFPNSATHLRLDGNSLIVTGQAYDAVESLNIIRLIRQQISGLQQILDMRSASAQSANAADRKAKQEQIRATIAVAQRNMDALERQSMIAHRGHLIALAKADKDKAKELKEVEGLTRSQARDLEARIADLEKLIVDLQEPERSNQKTKSEPRKKIADADAERAKADQEREEKARPAGAIPLLPKSLNELRGSTPTSKTESKEPGLALPDSVRHLYEPLIELRVEEQLLLLTHGLDHPKVMAKRLEIVATENELKNVAPKGLDAAAVEKDGKKAPENKTVSKKGEPSDSNVVIPLKYVAADETAKILEDAFNGPPGREGGDSRRVERIRIVADPVTNALTVRATPLDLVTLRRILDRIDVRIELQAPVPKDKQSPGASSAVNRERDESIRRDIKAEALEKDEELETYMHKCIYVKASQAELFLKDILGEPSVVFEIIGGARYFSGGAIGKAFADAPKQPPMGKYSIRSDDRTNTVFVNAGPKLIARAKAYFAKFDQPQVLGQPPLQSDAVAARPKADPAAKNSATDYRVVQLTNVQAKEIASVLGKLFASDDGKGLTIVAEPMTNSLLVRGSAEQQAAVAAIVQRLEDAARGNEATRSTGAGAVPGTKPGKTP